MSEVKHTPAPWIWDDEFHGLYGAGPDNAVLAYANYEGMWLSFSKGREANARLISAAPDLLAALKALRNACIGMVPDCAPMVDAAILKAEGEE